MVPGCTPSQMIISAWTQAQTPSRTAVLLQHGTCTTISSALMFACKPKDAGTQQTLEPRRYHTRLTLSVLSAVVPGPGRQSANALEPLIQAYLRQFWQ